VKLGLSSRVSIRSRFLFILGFVDAQAAPMTERMCAFCARDFPAV